jgi:predicted nucleic acid-binding protein
VVEFERAYLDASVILRLTLGQKGAIRAKWGRAVSSELLSTELFRTLDRLRLAGLDDSQAIQIRSGLEDNLTQIAMIRLDSAVLRRAGGSFPIPLGALDAIHLATALMYFETSGEELVMLTHDRQLAAASQACGLQAYPSPV